MNKNRVKKFWYLAAALGIFSCAAFAYRYSGRSFDDSLRPWRDVRSEFPEIENKLAKGKYKYLEGNVKIRMKETDAVYQVRVTRKCAENRKTFVEESLEMFGKFQDEIRRDRVKICGTWGKRVYLSDIEEEVEAGDSEYEECFEIQYPGEKEYGRPMRAVRTKSGTWTGKGTAYSLMEEEVEAYIQSISGGESEPDLEISRSEGKFYDLRGVQELPDVSYPLWDGEVSLQEAVDTFEEQINVDGNYYYPDPNPAVHLAVTELYPRKLKDGLYEYCFQVTEVYDGIPLDSVYNLYDSLKNIEKFDYPEDRLLGGGSATMVEKGKLDMTTGCDRVCDTRREDGPMTEGLSLDYLLTQLSKRLERGTKTHYQVLHIEFIYQQEVISTGHLGDEVTDEIYRWRPIWKVICAEEDTGAYVAFYLDPVTEDIWAEAGE